MALHEEELALIALTQIEGVGGKVCRRLRERWGSLAAFWEGAPLPEAIRAEASDRTALRYQAETIADTCEKYRIEVIPFWSERFPVLLRHIPAAPAILYRRGSLEDLSRLSVAVVGTRKPDNYGLQATEAFTEALVEAGAVIVSGLAYGIDARAHQTALAKGGLTVAVLAHGLDIVYPPLHKSLAEKILSQGALLSEYPPGDRLHPMRFPHRNRIIAGLSHLTLVVQSKVPGGALTTARAAFAADRPVFAVPGPIFSPLSEGCHQLIYEQIAQIAYSPAVVINELKSQAERLPFPTGERGPIAGLFSEEKPRFSDPVDQAIYEAVVSGLHLLDDVAAQVGRPIQEVAHRVVFLEIEGWLVQEPGNRVRLAKLPGARP
jgi:DNA processing protein